MKLTKKLFITIMTMALLVVTFSASTFAWFTLGQDSKIENFKVNVQAGAGMEISADGKNWRNNINLADLNLTDVTFNAVTTYENLNKGVDFYNEKGEKVTTGYFEMTFYVRITNRNNDSTHPGTDAAFNAGDFDYVALTAVEGNDVDFTGLTDGAAATASTENEKQWLADVSFDATASTVADNQKAYDAQKVYNFDPLNAVKISFTKNAATSAATLFGYENAASQGGVALDGVAKEFAKEKGYDLTNECKTPTDENADATTAGTLPSYVAVKKGQEIAVADNTKVLLKSDFADLDSANLKDLKDLILADYVKLGQNETQPYEANNFLYAKVTVRIWLDGWDADCINAILDKETTLSFKLTAGKNA